MSDTANRVFSHQVHADVSDALAELAQAESLSGADPLRIELIARIRAVLILIQGTLKAANPILAPSYALNNISGAAQNARGQIQQFISSSSVDYLQNAVDQLDSAFSYLSALTIGSMHGTSPHLVDSIQAYTDVIAKSSRRLQGEFDELSSKAGSLDSQVTAVVRQLETTRSEIAILTSGLQQQFSDAQERRINEFRDAQDRRAGEFEASEKDRATLFVADQDSFRNETRTAFEKWDATSKSAIEVATKQRGDEATMFSQTLTALDDEYRKKASHLVDSLEERRKEADVLVGIIAERGVTSNYQKVANEARREMWMWHVATVATLVGLAGIAVVEFLPALKDGWNWGAFAARVFVSTALLLLAGYAGAQARNAQEVMRKNRQREMDLNAIGPYLHSLPDEMQQDFRLRLADRTFVPIESAERGRPVVALSQDAELRKAIIEIVKSALVDLVKK